MTSPAEEARRLGLTIESDFCDLQAPIDGRRAILAAVYPHDRKIVLFEKNIAAHCAQNGANPDEERDRLIRHEAAHYREWMKCRRDGKKWRPRCWKEELRIRRAEAVHPDSVA